MFCFPFCVDLIGRLQAVCPFAPDLELKNIRKQVASSCRTFDSPVEDTTSCRLKIWREFPWAIQELTVVAVVVIIVIVAVLINFRSISIEF